MNILDKIIIIMTIVCVGISKSNALLPQEEFIFYELTPQAQEMIVFRPYDNKKYRLTLGVGCLPALFDDLKNNTKIYTVKFGDLLEPYGNGDVGLVYIETPLHKVSCKIVNIQAD